MFRARRLFSRELAWSCFLATCAFFLVVGVSTGCPVCALFCLVTDMSAAFITEEPSIWRPPVSGATILSLQDLHSVAVRILQRAYDVDIYFLLKMPSDLTPKNERPCSSRISIGNSMIHFTIRNVLRRAYSLREVYI